MASTAQQRAAGPLAQSIRRYKQLLFVLQSGIQVQDPRALCRSGYECVTNLPLLLWQEAGGGLESEKSKYCQRITSARRSHGEPHWGPRCRDTLQVCTYNHMTLTCHLVLWELVCWESACSPPPLQALLKACLLLCRVEIISDAFKGKNPVQCHRTVYGILDEELKNGVHALSLKAKAAWEMPDLSACMTPNTYGTYRMLYVFNGWWHHAESEIGCSDQNNISVVYCS